MHAESKKERKAKTCGDDKGNEEELGMMNDRVQTPCERSSSTKWGKDDRRRANHKTSKVKNLY